MNSFISVLIKVYNFTNYLNISVKNHAMTNPLTSLDELIWKQFEKVTVAANKRLGWNKYDLVQITDDVTAVAMVGYGVYIGLPELIKDQYLSMCTPSLMMSAAGLSIGMSYLKCSRIINQWYEEKEVQDILRTGAGRKPSFDSLRPLTLAVATTLSAGSIFDTHPHPNENVYTALNLGLIMIGMLWCTKIASDYFYSQLMTPPSAKKSIWKAVTDYITKPFHKATPQPVESGVKYQMIDDYASH